MKAASTFVVVLALHAAAVAGSWTVAPGGPSEIVFVSKAAIESFEGSTDRVEGTIVADPGALTGAIDIEITVDLASLDTGIGLRNRHMRENHLHTDDHPVAVFRAGRVVRADPSDLATIGSSRVELVGTLDLHGVVRPLTVAADLELDPDGTLDVACDFTVKLSDHDIPRPKFLIMKLADEQKVRVRLRAATSTAGGGGS